MFSIHLITTQLQEPDAEIYFSLILDATIKQANWDPSKVRDKLKRDIEAEILSVRATKLSELNERYEVYKYTMVKP
jgi:hypothetical protein